MNWRMALRIPILFLLLAALLTAAAMGFYLGQTANADSRYVQTELTDHRGNTDQSPALPACEPRGRYGQKPAGPPNGHTQCEAKPNAPGRNR